MRCVHCYLPAGDAAEEELTTEEINNLGNPYRCSIGSQLRIAPNGDVYPCQCFHFGSEYRIGNVKKQSLEEIVNSKKLREIIKTCFARPSKIDQCKVFKRNLTRFIAWKIKP